MLCSICFNEIEAVGSWTEGNSAEPVNYGRCCNACDNNVVIPSRLSLMTRKIPPATYIKMLQEQYAAIGDALRLAEVET